MFESIGREQTLRDRFRWLLLPVVVGILMDIPLEFALYTRVKGPAAMFFVGLSFHAIIVASVSFGMPHMRGALWPTFLTKDENSWFMTVVNIVFYMLLTVW